MLKNLRKRIESKRGSPDLIWKIFIRGKDVVWLAWDLIKNFFYLKEVYYKFKFKDYWSRQSSFNENIFEIEIKAHEEIVRQCRLGVVEIGVMNARTSRILAKANLNIPVYGIDPLVPDSMNKNEIGSKQLIDGNMKEFHNFKFFNDYSYNVVKKWDRPFDYIFIDGNHLYGYVKRDFEDWFPKLSKGGWISFHDSTANRGGPNYWPGPSELADKLLKDDRLEHIASVGALTIFRKK